MTATVSLPSIDKFVLRLARRAWEIAIAIKHRRELTRLADRDDRMLTDDLYDARSEPFWADPTTFLQQRVRRRRYK